MRGAKVWKCIIIFVKRLKFALMKRFFSLILIISLFASCASPEPAEPAPTPDVPMALVTVPDRSEEVTEAAVRSVAVLFDAAPATRAGERVIGSIHTLRSQAGDPLCYVVNYADDKGFIVVSATKDYMPVLAFSDEGAFDVAAVDKTGVSVWLAEQQVVIERAAELPDSVRLRCRAMWEAYNTTREPFWTGPVTRSDADVVNLITRSIREWEADGYTVYRLLDFKESLEFQQLPDEVQRNLLQLPYGYANFNYGGVYAVSFLLKKNTTLNTYIQPMLHTKWDQVLGYNEYIPYHGYVGCTAVAVGQIMKYHRFPPRFDWDGMLNDCATDITASFLYGVGQAIGIQYDKKDYGGPNSNVRDAFIEFGYKNVSLHDHAKYTVLNDLKKKSPVYMVGYHGSKGHAWVCDGAWSGTTFTELKLMTLEYCPEGYEPKQFLNPYTNSEITGYIPTQFHMNWGWGGLYDGYYIDDNIEIQINNGEIRRYMSDRIDITNIYPVI